MTSIHCIRVTFTVLHKYTVQVDSAASLVLTFQEGLLVALRSCCGGGSHSLLRLQLAVLLQELARAAASPAGQGGGGGAARSKGAGTRRQFKGTAVSAGQGRGGVRSMGDRKDTVTVELHTMVLYTAALYTVAL